MPRRLVASFLVLALLLAQAHRTPAQEGPLKGLDDYIAKSMKEWEVPGLAIAIVKDDKIILAKGYGVRKLGESTPVDAKTIFAIGSCTKAFTATALAMLVDDGKLKWDDPVVKVLPGFQLYDPYVTREITIRDLLCHRSGLERFDMVWFASPADRNEVLQRLRFARSSWSFRSKFGYQNIMYSLAGQILPVVRLKTWDQFITGQICAPLGMESTVTSTKGLQGQPDVATPHQKIDDKVRPIAWRNLDNVGPAGSINSCVADMAQWVRLNLGEGMFEKKRLVSAAAIQEMQSPQMVIPLEGAAAKYYPDAHFHNYGLGWFLSDYHGRKVVEHGGSIDGMRALVALLPEEKLGLVVLSNLWNNRLPSALMYRVFDAYLTRPAHDWSADFLKVSKSTEEEAKKAANRMEEERISGTKPSVSLDQFSGRYHDDLYGDVLVESTDGGLKISYGPAYQGPLEHWHYDTFRVTWTDRTLGKSMATFRLDARGKVEDMKLSLGGSSIILRRLGSAPKS